MRMREMRDRADEMDESDLYAEVNDALGGASKLSDVLWSLAEVMEGIRDRSRIAALPTSILDVSYKEAADMIRECAEGLDNLVQDSEVFGMMVEDEHPREQFMEQGYEKSPIRMYTGIHKEIKDQIENGWS